MVSKKTLDHFLELLLMDLADNRFSLSTPRDRIRFLIEVLKKTNHLICSLQYLKADSDLPKVAFNVPHRGYQIVLTSDDDEERFQQMCVATVVILDSKKALKEYNNYTSTTEFFRLNPEVKSCYSQILNALYKG